MCIRKCGFTVQRSSHFPSLMSINNAIIPPIEEKADFMLTTFDKICVFEKRI